MPEPISNDLAGTPCSQAACFDVSDTIAQIRIRVDPLVGVPPEEEVMTLTVPICGLHAHLLRMGGTLVGLDAGL